MNKQPIIISGYPKSGNTWLTRLLGDVLNSPTGASHPSEDHKEIATEGQDRSGKYIVRKGHYRLPDVLHNSGVWPLFDYTAIPSPHVLIPTKLMGDEKLVFIIRDPRDIITSACHHWKNKSKDEIIGLVCYGGLAKLPAWDEYLKQWRQVKQAKWIKYEDLVDNPLNAIQFILNISELNYDADRLVPAIDRQSFDNRKKQIEQDSDRLYLGREYNLRFMRKGTVGDYKNFLTAYEQELIWDILGEAMEKYGYVK